jgi:hypothetical protein
VEQITLTVDEEDLPATAALAQYLRTRGFAVVQAAFVQTNVQEERRPILLLTVRRSLEGVMELVTMLLSTAPTGGWRPLASTVHALSAGHALAVVQLKADTAFLSLAARDLTDLAQALHLLPIVAPYVSRGKGGSAGEAGEVRLVYSGAEWRIYGVGPGSALVYDAARGQVRVADEPG